MIYAIVNTKGGVGKSTTAVHLATMLARTRKTLLIDGDPQATSAAWSAWRQETEKHQPSATTICLQGKAVLTEGKKLEADYDDVVIDAGGRDNVALRSALLLAERVIIPIGASSFDTAALTDLMTIVEIAKEFKPDLDIRILLSRVDARVKETAEMVEYLHSEELTLLPTFICERVAYRRSTKEGATVQELAKDKAAITEMDVFLIEATCSLEELITMACKPKVKLEAVK